MPHYVAIQFVIIPNLLAANGAIPERKFRFALEEKEQYPCEPDDTQYRHHRPR
jgi:hypothetical protein